MAEVATRDWHIKARLRVLEDYACESLEPRGIRRFRAGEEIIYLQWGRAGSPVDRDHWCDSYDIDGMHVIPAEKVQVVEVLEEVDPEPVVFETKELERRLKELLLRIRKHAAHIFVRVNIGGRWQNASLAELDDELWAEHVTGFIVAWVTEGFVPVRVKTEAEQDAASEGDRFEAGA